MKFSDKIFIFLVCLTCIMLLLLVTNNVRTYTFSDMPKSSVFQAEQPLPEASFKENAEKLLKNFQDKGIIPKDAKYWKEDSL